MSQGGGGNVKEGWSAWWSFARIPEFPVEAAKTALIVIDMTYQQAHRDYGLCKRIIESGFEDDLAYYLDRIDRVVVPNLQRLIAAFRSAGAPVIYTRCASLVGDGSDQTWRHRHFGVVTTVDSRDAQILEPLAPQEGDIMLTKSGSAVFPSTNCEHLLRVKGITTIVVSGIFTNSCVEGTIRLAGDLDFRCLMPEDSCAAMSPSGHANAIEYLDGNFCHVKPTAEIIRLLDQGADAAAA